MRATFSGLEIAKTGLTVSQIGLDVTAHNISNVDTQGYTRQRIVTTAYDPAATLTKLRPVTQALVGSGTKIMVLDQIRSSFLDRQYRTENSLHSYYQTRSQGLTYVQSYFESEAETTINDNIDKFFGAISMLTGDTVEYAQRLSMHDAGKLLAENFNMVYSGLLDIQSNQNTAVKVTVGEINTIAQSIAELNKSIYSFELSGGQFANDLRDKRNLLLDELSGIIDIEYEEVGTSETDMRFVVKIGGEELVNHTVVNKLGVVEVDNEIDGIIEGKKYTPCWLDPNGDPDPSAELDMTKTAGGRLKAYMDLRDGDEYNNQGIPYYLRQINNLARAIVQSVNAIHSTGWTYPNDGTASQTGINFFYDPGDIMQVTAKDIRLSDEVAGNGFNIACSDEEIIYTGTPPQLISGNNEKIKELYRLFDRRDITLHTGGTPAEIDIGGLYGYMSGVTLDMATNLSNCNDTLENKTKLALDAENQRLSISGVSLDEEMTNLIKFQHAYSGASRILNAMDEAIDILINRTGRVGL